MHKWAAHSSDMMELGAGSPLPDQDFENRSPKHTKEEWVPDDLVVEMKLTGKTSLFPHHSGPWLSDTTVQEKLRNRPGPQDVFDSIQTSLLVR